MNENQPQTKKLNIIRCDAAHHGTSASGNPWTLYEVAATNEAGEPIEEKLKSFDELPEGLGDYEVERREDPKYGVSYTLKIPKGEGGGGGSPGARLGPKVDELRGRVEHLEMQVRDYQTRLEGIERAIAQGGPTPTSYGKPPEGAPDPSKWGEDAPFLREEVPAYEELKGAAQR